MDLVIAEAQTEWNGDFKAALSIQVRVGCTFLTSVGLREGVQIIAGVPRVSSFSKGWTDGADWDGMISISLTDHSAYISEHFQQASVSACSF